MTETTVQIPGPNAATVTAILTRAAALTRAQITTLAGACFESSTGHPMESAALDLALVAPTEWDDAYQAAKDAAYAEGWQAGVDAVQIEAMKAVRHAVWTESHAGFSDALAEFAALGAESAALATLVGHLIAADQAALLAAPWHQVIA